MYLCFHGGEGIFILIGHQSMWYVGRLYNEIFRRESVKLFFVNFFSIVFLLAPLELYANGSNSSVATIKVLSAVNNLPAINNVNDKSRACLVVLETSEPEFHKILDITKLDTLKATADVMLFSYVNNTMKEVHAYDKVSFDISKNAAPDRLHVGVGEVMVTYSRDMRCTVTNLSIAHGIVDYKLDPSSFDGTATISAIDQGGSVSQTVFASEIVAELFSKKMLNDYSETLLENISIDMFSFSEKITNPDLEAKILAFAKLVLSGKTGIGSSIGSCTEP